MSQQVILNSPLKADPRSSVEYDIASNAAKLSWDRLEELETNKAAKSNPKVNDIPKMLVGMFAADGITVDGYHTISTAIGHEGLNPSTSIGRICRDCYPNSPRGDAGFEILRNASLEHCKADAVRYTSDKNFQRSLREMEILARDIKDPFSAYAKMFVVLSGIIAQHELQGSLDLIDGKFQQDSTGYILTRAAYKLWQSLDNHVTKPAFTSEQGVAMHACAMLAAQTAMQPERFSHLSRSFLYSAMNLYTNRETPQPFNNIEETLHTLPSKELNLGSAKPNDLSDYSMPDFKRVDFADKNISEIKSRIATVHSAYNIISETGSDKDTTTKLRDPLVQMLHIYGTKLTSEEKQKELEAIRRRHRELEEIAIARQREQEAQQQENARIQQLQIGQLILRY